MTVATLHLLMGNALKTIPEFSVDNDMKQNMLATCKGEDIL
jgi:hypothetical protein